MAFLKRLLLLLAIIILLPVVVLIINMGIACIVLAWLVGGHYF